VDESDPCQDIAQAIEAYLLVNPSAADVLEGVAGWWLGAGLKDVPVKAVERTLEDLVARGLLERRHLFDGRVLYARPPLRLH
jgi:hypothetical protein